MILFRNLLFYLAFYGGSVGYVSAAMVLSFFDEARMRRTCDGWGRWHQWCCAHILGIRIRETGSRPNSQAFYAIKHEAFLEAIALPAIFDNPAAFAKEELFRIPGWGRVSRVYGNIPVARDKGATALRAMLREVRPALAAGRPIVIFPEGTRVAHGTRPDLQAGFAALYKLVGLPVVPVAVDSGPLYHRWLKRPGTVTLHFGDPIEPGLPRAAIEARVHAAINLLNAPEPSAAKDD